jgi:hypothetical protein
MMLKPGNFLINNWNAAVPGNSLVLMVLRFLGMPFWQAKANN